MSIYRHATNLHTPLGNTDLGFLMVLGDYRIGAPVKTDINDNDHPLDTSDLILAGVVGLYTTRQALKNPDIRKLSGWSNPDRILTVPWRPFGNVPTPEMSE